MVGVVVRCFVVSAFVLLVVVCALLVPSVLLLSAFASAAALECVVSANLHPVVEFPSGVGSGSKSNSCQATADHGAHRTKRFNRSTATRAAALTADVSPAPSTGTYLRLASSVHDQRRVSRVGLALRSRTGTGAGPGSGSGSRSGLVGGGTGPRLGLPKDASLSGDATWALTVGAATLGLDVGMWY